jgi:hypothetical protein
MASLAEFATSLGQSTPSALDTPQDVVARLLKVIEDRISVQTLRLAARNRARDSLSQATVELARRRDADDRIAADEVVYRRADEALKRATQIRIHRRTFPHEGEGHPMRKVCFGAAVAATLAACAGRDPQPIATVQVTDTYATCAQISAEIQANNIKVQELADEQGLKTAQNVAAGVAGLVIWPLWFAMDFKGAASKEVTALQARQQYLTALATERCASPEGAPKRPAPKSASGREASAQ